MKILILAMMIQNPFSWEYYATFNAKLTSYIYGYTDMKITCRFPEERGELSRCIGKNTESVAILHCSTEQRELCSGWFKDI